MRRKLAQLALDYHTRGMLGYIHVESALAGRNPPENTIMGSLTLLFTGTTMLRPFALTLSP